MKNKGFEINLMIIIKIVLTRDGDHTYDLSIDR